jgi:hypothetical protein
LHQKKSGRRKRQSFSPVITFAVKLFLIVVNPPKGKVQKLLPFPLCIATSLLLLPFTPIIEE